MCLKKIGKEPEENLKKSLEIIFVNLTLILKPHFMNY
jgi:hypothetical protein